MPRKRKSDIIHIKKEDEMVAVTPSGGRPVRAARLNHRVLGTPKKSPELEEEESPVASSQKKRRKKETSVALRDLLEELQSDSATMEVRQDESEITIEAVHESAEDEALEELVEEEQDVTREAEGQEASDEGDPSEEIICIECPPMNALSTPFILELPQLTRKVMLKAQVSTDTQLMSTSVLQQTMEVFSSVQATLSQSTVSALNQRDPHWVEAIAEKTKVTIEGDTVAGSSDSFSAATVRIQQLLAAEMSCVQTDGSSDNMAAADLSEASEDKSKLVIVEGGAAVCPFCQKSFQSGVLKKKHVLKEHEPVKESVSLPVFGSIHWDQVLIVVLPAKEEPTKCTLCNYKDKDFPAHFKEKHADAAMHCRYCGSPFEDKKRLRMHVTAHVEASALVQCKYCEREGAIHSMKRHVSSKHEAEPALASDYSKVKRFFCPGCRRKFRDRDDCHVHMTECTRSHHSDLDQYMVEIDPMEPDEVEEIEVPEDDVVEQPNIRMTKCRSCSFAGSMWQVTSHYKRHHAAHKHSCPHCEVTFSTVFALTKHKRTHFDSKGNLKPQSARLNKLLKCKLCSFHSSRMGLMMHLPRAHGIQGNTEAESGELFSCKHCPKVFTKQNAFNCHEWRCKQKNEKNIKAPGQSRMSRINEYKDVAAYIREADDVNEQVTETPNLADAVLRYDEATLSKDEKRKIVSAGIEQLPELFPNNGFNVDMKHIFKCKDCPYISTCNGSIIHRRRHHRQAQHKCPHCPKEYVMKCELDRHKRSHYDANGNPTLKIPKGETAEEPSTYIIGNKCYQTAGKGKDRVSDHLENIHHLCTECGYKGTYVAVSQHVRHEHLGTTLCCRFCEKVFLSVPARDSHEDKHRMPDGTIQPLGSKGIEKRTFSCSHCGQMFRMKQHMERHVARKHSAKTFACEQCSNTYSLEVDLATHIRIKHTTIEKMTCALCGAEFACMAYLKNHHRRVHDVKQWLQCHECQKLCKDSEALQRHLKIHQPDHVKMRHKCPQCPKSFSSDTYLRDHLNVHSGDRPYECTDCSATFMTQSVFSRHKQKHKSSIECPYDDCGAKFRVLIDQVKHVNKMHADVSTYVCSHCGKLFLNKKRMLYHECEKGLITVDGVKQEEGEVAAQQLNTEEEENLVYMCAQCDIIMSSWDEMEQHALTCDTSEGADMVPVASEDLPDSEHVVIQEAEGIYSVEMVELQTQ